MSVLFSFVFVKSVKSCSPESPTKSTGMGPSTTLSETAATDDLNRIRYCMLFCTRFVNTKTKPTEMGSLHLVLCAPPCQTTRTNGLKVKKYRNQCPLFTKGKLCSLLFCDTRNDREKYMDTASLDWLYLFPVNPSAYCYFNPLLSPLHFQQRDAISI